jgi:hypothetical protein
MKAPLPKLRELTVAQITARIEAAEAMVLVTINSDGDVSVITQGLANEAVPGLLRDTAMHLEGPDA